jgi:hypothetical protein
MQFITLIILAILCLLLTVSVALLVGSLNVDLFDFKNLNFTNMIPILIIGGFISCVIIGICFLFFARTAFFKAKDYLDENQKNDYKGESKK